MNEYQLMFLISAILNVFLVIFIFITRGCREYLKRHLQTSFPSEREKFTLSENSK